MWIRLRIRMDPKLVAKLESGTELVINFGSELDPDSDSNSNPDPT
jgi:hypothetical protein